jgi:hypothetical protein
MSSEGVKITWKGDALKAQIDKATESAVNETLDDAVAQAKSNHPGWKNETGNAEAGIRAEKAKKHGDGHYEGQLVGETPYDIFLEIGARGHAGDHTLRRAADVHFPKLGEKIKKRL